MKFFVFLFILILCTACAPQGLPAAESSPTLIATKLPTSTPLPTSTTPALLLPSPSPTPMFDILIDNIAVDQQGHLYASGFGKQYDLRHFARWDGGKWIELGNGFQTAGGNALAVDSTGRLYTAILTESRPNLTTTMMRWNGTRWEEITGNFGTVVEALKAGRLSSNIPAPALAVDGEDNLYAAGSYFYSVADHPYEWPMGYVAKWDKDSWTVLGQGFDKVNIFNMAVGVTGNLYVSGEQPLTPEGNNSFITQWNKDTWTEINTSKLINTPQGMAVDSTGRLYANSQWAVISYWNGADWITIADQLGGEAPAVSDMAAGRNDQLCIGGSFETVNAIPAWNIACWDGSSWHALGDGVNERVNALTFDPDGNLYAVGYFTEAGGLPVDHAARWDGETWHALGQ